MDGPRRGVPDLIEAPVKAVLFDFGGVILTSPFEAFSAYERDNGLPDGLLRRLNATNPDTNAWARLERSEVDLDRFCALFEAEATDAGHRIDARAVLALLSGEVRPAMLEALRRISAAGVPLAMLTNNFVTGGPGDDVDEVRRERARERTGDIDLAEVLSLFDVVIESSKAGVRKPDPAAYRLVLDELGVAAEEVVFLDDLGVNLKPARALGMRTIKVVDPDVALAELQQVLGFPLS